MNWEDQAWDETERLDKANEIDVAEGHDGVFVMGAEWQRDQLRTDEAIERVARAIARLEPDEAWPDETIIDDEYRDECHETALAAINALLGDT